MISLLYRKYLSMIYRKCRYELEREILDTLLVIVSLLYVDDTRLAVSHSAVHTPWVNQLHTVIIFLATFFFSLLAPFGAGISSFQSTNSTQYKEGGRSADHPIHQRLLMDEWNLFLLLEAYQRRFTAYMGFSRRGYDLIHLVGHALVERSILHCTSSVIQIDG